MLLTRLELAKILKVSLRTVDKLKAEGMPRPHRNEEPQPPRIDELVLVPYNYGLSNYDDCDLEL